MILGRRRLVAGGVQVPGWNDDEDADLRVFISYRRSDCQPQANGLHDGLLHRLDNASVFMDVDSIPYGADFEEHIRNEIEQCDVVLALIGDNWLDVDEEGGGRRIDDPGDFVRLEIENALNSPRVRVIPVLVEGATMPRSTDLPDVIRGLARINAIELSDQRWKSDVERLAKVLDDIRSSPMATGGGAHNITLADVDGVAIEAVVSELPHAFQTKDVSEHPAVVAAHGNAAEARNYHAMVGTYLSRSCSALGIRSLGKSTNGRGERWGRDAVAPPAPPPTPRPIASPAYAPDPGAPPQYAPRHPGGAPPGPGAPPAYAPQSRGGAAYPVPETGSGAYRPPQPHQAQPQPFAAHGQPGGTLSRGGSGRWMIALPFLSMGLAAWVPAVRAATKAKDPATRRKLQLTGGAIAAGALLGFILFGSAPTDATGTATGPASDIGGILLLLSIVAGTWVAVTRRPLGRKSTELSAVPGAERALADRQLREQYRDIVVRDPDLAREMAVGRPDLARSYHDGGLLDLNSLPAPALAQHAGLSPAEAQRAVEARERYGGLSGIDDLVVFADLNPRTAERLRDRAVFL